MLKSKKLAFYIPFVLIFIGFIALYSCFNWYYIIQPSSELISKDLANYWLPLVLPIIPVFIIFHFILKSVRPTWMTPAIFYFIAALCIAPAAIIAQSYLEFTTGKLAKISDISQISQYPKVKYYALRNYFIDKSNASIYRTCDSVKDGWDFDMYIVCPIMERAADTTAPFFSAWLTKKYYKTIGTLDSGKDHIPIEELFWEKNETDFEETDLRSFQYFEKIPHDYFYKGFETAVKNSSKYNPVNPIVLLDASNKSLEERHNTKLFWFLFSCIVGNGIFLVLLYFDNKDYPVTEFIEQSDNVAGSLQ